MTPWGEMHEEFKIARVTPMSKLEECTVQLSKELEATIVNKKIKKLKIKKIMIFEDCVLKLLTEHNYHLLRKDGDRNYQHIHS